MKCPWAALNGLPRLWLAAGLSLLLTPWAAAQQPPESPELPFTGVVVQNNVNVRSGAGEVYYIVGEADRGQLVRVEDIIFDWYKIQPPEGITSYISKAFVDARGDGQTGVVNVNDRAKVKAASVKSPGESYRVQVLLNRGDRVRILGEEGSFYRIEPPQGAYVFLPPDSVRPATEQDIARAQGGGSQDLAEPDAPDEPDAPGSPEPDIAEPDATEPPDAEQDAEEVGVQPQEPQAQQPDPALAPEPLVEDAETQPSPAPPPNDQREPSEPTDQTQPAEPTAATQPDEPDEPATPEGPPPGTQPREGGLAQAQSPPATQPAQRPPVQTPAVSEALRQVEQQNLPLFENPVTEQPIAQMIRAYEGVQAQADLPAVDQRIIRRRLAALRHNQRVAEALSRIATVEQQVEQADREQERRAQERADEPVLYDAVGRLQASSVYDGENLPRLYRLVAPASGRTIVYVEPGDPVDEAQMFGELVGIVGERRYDPSVRPQVLSIERIDVLEAVPSQ